MENTNTNTNTNTNININISQESQPLVIIGTQGRVANGKSSLIRALTGINPMKFTKEAEKNMTIKLGYTNARFYKCTTCPEPWCYQVGQPECIQCGMKTELKLNVSFVDSPGHNDLQATALSGASNMDFCLLVVAADCEQDPETNEHYKAIKILGLDDSTIVLHNKIDLVSKDVALERWEKLKQTYGVKVKFILPICAQFGFGLNYLMQFLVESIPNPINSKLEKKINSPLKVSIIRSFDVNKPSTPVDKIVGAVVGGTIKTGYLKIGDKVKIVPGIVLANGQNHPIEAYIETLKTDTTPLKVAYPGGLIGIGLSIDPTLSKEDRLVGNFIIGLDDKTNKIFKTCTIKYFKYNLETNLDIKKGDSFVCMLGSIKRMCKINWIDKKKDELNFTSSVVMAGEIGDSVVITKSNHIELYGNILEIEE
jgi:translation initiation factor 2 subunit 3